jgi:hypothetical protein
MPHYSRPGICPVRSGLASPRRASPASPGTAPTCTCLAAQDPALPDPFKVSPRRASPAMPSPALPCSTQPSDARPDHNVRGHACLALSHLVVPCRSMPARSGLASPRLLRSYLARTHQPMPLLACHAKPIRALPDRAYQNPACRTGTRLPGPAKSHLGGFEPSPTLSNQALPAMPCPAPHGRVGPSSVKPASPLCASQCPFWPFNAIPGRALAF